MFSRSLSTWFGSFAARRRKSRSSRRKAALGLESLEHRATPTVVFIPHFGAESVSGSNDGMQDPAVCLIFSGSYWSTPQGQQDESTLLNSAKNILSGPYLGGLTQYDSDGKARFALSWTDRATVPFDTSTGPTADDVQDLLQATIPNHDAAPGFADARHAPIHVVVSDPNSSQGYNGGWNAPGEYSVWLSGFGGMEIGEPVHMIWVGTSTDSSGIGVWKDAFTETLSHELAETISDPDSNGITVAAPSGLPTSVRGDDQIGDNEPAPANQPHYGYSLNGDLVQPYWSRQDNAFIVPDGRAQKTYLVPIWNSDNTFTGTYSMALPSAVADNGSGLYYADASGDLQHSSPSGWTAIASGVRSIAVGGDGGVYVNFLDNDLFRYVWGQGWQAIASGVRSIAVGGDGGVYVDLVTNRLFRYVWGQGWQVIDPKRDVRSIAVGGDGGVYVSYRNGDLGRYVWGQGWQVIDAKRDVRAPADARHQPGRPLDRAGPPRWCLRQLRERRPQPLRLGPGRWVVDGNRDVRSIAAANDRSLIVVKSDGPQCRYDLGTGRIRIG